MNALIKFGIVSALIVGITTYLALLVPQPMTDAMHSAAVEILSYIGYAGGVIEVATVFAALHVVLNFLSSLLLFAVLYFLVRWLAQ